MAQIELRDGWREVPDHVALLLAPHADQLYHLTYDEAIALANNELVRQRANAEFDKIVSSHLRTHGR